MAEVNYFLKEPNSKKETLIYLFFSYNNQRLKYSIGEKIIPELWNFESQKAKTTKKFPEYPEFNSRLDYIKSSVKTIYRKFLNDGIEPHNNLLRDELNKLLKYNGELAKRDLFSFIKNYIEESKFLKKKTTIASYNTSLRLLQEYSNEYNKTLDFNDINLEFYNSFVSFLTTRDYSKNTISKHIKILKTFLNEATERGLNQSLEFKKRKFKRVEEETAKIYLNKEEIDKIYNLNLNKDKQLENIRDLFVIGCYTGLRFSDFSQLKPENIIGGNKVKINTTKTGELVVIPLHSCVKEIIKKYKGEIPKAMSNPKMNLYLKYIGKIAKIDEGVETSITKGGKQVKNYTEKYNLITTHTARRSFATNLYLADVPAITIMKITGHKTEKSFLRYIRISQEENANKLLSHEFFKE